jgi:hypothetical protein
MQYRILEISISYLLKSWKYPYSNTKYSFPICIYSTFIPWIILEAPLNNNALPSKDIPIIEAINGNIIDIQGKINIAIPNPIPANRDL